MIWQDAVIAAVQVVFVAVLLPAVRAPAKPPLSTSIPTAVGLAVIAGAMATLGLWYASATAGLSGSLWAVLAYQKARS